MPGVSATLIYLGPNRNGSLNVKTDEKGRYTFQSLPRAGPGRAFSFPPTHVQEPGQGWEDFTVPGAAQGDRTCPKESCWSLPRRSGAGSWMRAGQPAPPASVQAGWLLTGARVPLAGASDPRDDQGNFSLEGLGPDATVTLNARLRDRQSKSPVKAQAGEADPVTIAISPMPVFAVAGRVLGPGGRHWPRFPVRVQIRVRRDNFPGMTEPARFLDTPRDQDQRMTALESRCNRSEGHCN